MSSSYEPIGLVELTWFQQSDWGTHGARGVGCREIPLLHKGGQGEHCVSDVWDSPWSP